MRTAISGSSLSSERSDSSASTTIHSPVPQPAFEPGRAQLAADDVGGVEAGAAQRVHGHRRGRRLAVGAGDGQAAAQRGDLGEQVGPVKLALGHRALGVLGGIAVE